MTDRKPLEELFDFPTSSAPGPRPEESAGDASEAPQQDLLFDELDAGGAGTVDAEELFGDLDESVPSEFGDGESWAMELDEAPETPSADSAALDGRITLAERWLGGAADVLLLLAVLCVALLSMLPLGMVPEREQWPGFALFLASFSYMYSTFPLAFWGQTPGMAWRGLRAINDDGLSLSFSQTTFRWLGGVVTVLLGGLPLVVAFSGRSLADRLSGSWTIRA